MRVSVVTPAFNSAATIGSCIRSVRGQTYQDIEHIVIDGGSRDETLDILNTESVRYISELDAGIYDAMNKGIALSTGELVAILNSDDAYIDCNVISDVVGFMVENDLDLCHTKIVQVDSTGKEIWVVGRPQTKGQLLQKMRVAHPGVFVRKSVYQKFGTFSVGLRIAGDYDFLLRVWERVRIGFLDRKTVNMGMEGASGTAHAKSLREAALVSALHGRSFCDTWASYHFNRFTHRIVLMLRALGMRRL